MSEFPGRGKVAVVKTSPASILEDVHKVMRLGEFERALPRDTTTGLKINISWQTWYPACSSAPWQIEGAILALQDAGYTDLVGVHNDTVVVDTAVGEINNRHRFVTDKHGIPCIYLYEENFEWFEYKPSTPLLVLDKVYPDGVFIPKALVGLNMIQLPTVKTHVFTTITGAMKNAFGGLLHRNRHWTHAVIHDTLVDLLMIPAGNPSGFVCPHGWHFRGRRSRATRHALASERHSSGLGGSGCHRFSICSAPGV